MKRINTVTFLTLIFGLSFAQAMTKKEACEVLEIASHDTFSEADVKNQYKKLALRYHPDRAEYNDFTPEEAQGKFNSLQYAVKVLLNEYQKSAVSNFLEQCKIQFNEQSGELREDLETFFFMGIPYAKDYRVTTYTNENSIEMAQESCRSEYLPIYYHTQKVITGLFTATFAVGLWSLYKLSLRNNSK